MIVGIDPGGSYWAAVSSEGVMLAGGKLRGMNKLAQVFGTVYCLAAKHGNALFVVEEPGRLIGRGVTLWQYVGVVKAAVEYAGGRWIGVSPAEAKQASGLGGNAIKPDMRQIAVAAGLEAARLPYWTAQGYTTLQAIEMAETVSDAYFIALAGATKAAVTLPEKSQKASKTDSSLHGIGIKRRFRGKFSMHR